MTQDETEARRVATLTDLSTRASSAGAGEQRELLEAAWAQIAVTAGCWDAISYWEAKEDAFRAILDNNTNEAFTAAAMMLVPEGYNWAIERTVEDFAGWCFDKNIMNTWASRAPTPALALLSAICRAEGGE